MPLDSNQTIKSKTRIYHIGLNQKEVAIIQGMFELQPALKNRFVFGEPSSRDQVDMVFVNGDDLGAIDEWQALTLNRPEVIPVMVCAEVRKKYKNLKTIKKPLAFRKFVEILDAVTSTEIERHSESISNMEAMRILVVDDSFPARQFMKYKLEELSDDEKKMLVDYADSGEKAIKMAEENAYDLVFLDVVMPGMDGYEICRKLKNIAPIKVAMLTGRSAVLNRARAKHAGCDYFLAKPPEDQDIKKVLSNLTN